ncbi:hypothetical protein [Azospirillum sp.]|uniref:hypothetical protein n=1 Tax=Azospirillum sp. TaxID=34012 RepID=UPI002D52EE5B|nr:hypothetical protein [Azospirillum sp.]HYF90101.1 hypothetical protein [Azospirillum sp.]
MQSPEFAVTAGWRLSIRRRTVQPNGAAKDEDLFEFTNDSVRAEIKTTRMRGLEGGATEVRLSGLRRPTIEKLLHEAVNKAAAGSFLVGRLHLYWHGRVPLPGVGELVSAVASLTGADAGDDTLAVTFAITEMTPDVDQVRYALRLKGPDAMYHALSITRTAGDIRAPDAEALAKAVVAALGVVPAGGSSKTPLAAAVSAVLPGAGPAGAGSAAATPAADQPAARKDLRGTDALAGIAGKIAEAIDSARDARALGAYLLRDDKILIGKEVLAAFESEARELAAGKSLISASPNRLGQGSATENGGFELLLRGEGRVKPGDVVMFPKPVPEQASLPGTGLAAADAVLSVAANVAAVVGGSSDNHFLLVDSVRHEISAKTGFTTTVGGQILKGKDKAELPAFDPQRRNVASDTGGSAEAIRSKMAALSGRAGLDVAEVRSFAPASTPGKPGQTSEILYGLGDRGGRSNTLRIVDVDRRTNARVAGVAYATPFAWGGYGMVLPRHPGTRVLIAQHGASADDAVDLGALWWSGDGNDKPGPPDAQPGDYWLHLPVAPKVKDQGGASDAIVPAADGSTHDLIDTGGSRVVQVGQLTVRIGEIVRSKNAAKRPSPEAEGLLIEVEGTQGKASLVIKPNGEVAITGKGSISLESDTSIDLSAPSITLAATGAGGTVELSAGATTLTVKNDKVEIE